MQCNVDAHNNLLLEAREYTMSLVSAKDISQKVKSLFAINFLCNRANIKERKRTIKS